MQVPPPWVIRWLGVNLHSRTRFLSSALNQSLSRNRREHSPDHDCSPDDPGGDGRWRARAGSTLPAPDPSRGLLSGKWRGRLVRLEDLPARPPARPPFDPGHLRAGCPGGLLRRSHTIGQPLVDPGRGHDFDPPVGHGLRIGLALQLEEFASEPPCESVDHLRGGIYHEPCLLAHNLVCADSVLCDLRPLDLGDQPCERWAINPRREKRSSPTD